MQALETSCSKMFKAMTGALAFLMRTSHAEMMLLFKRVKCRSCDLVYIEAELGGENEIISDPNAISAAAAKICAAISTQLAVLDGDLECTAVEIGGRIGEIEDEIAGANQLLRFSPCRGAHARRRGLRRVNESDYR